MSLNHKSLTTDKLYYYSQVMNDTQQEIFDTPGSSA